MANLIERAMDLLKLTYEEYDEDEDEDDYEDNVRVAKKNKKEDKKEKETRSYEAGNGRDSKTTMQSNPRKNWNRAQNEGGSLNSKVERAPIRSSSRVSVVKGGNNMESEIISVRPKDDKTKLEIGEHLLNGKTVLINMEGLEVDVAQRIVDFTSGVCYAIKGDMKFPSKYIVIAVPDEVGLSGYFENTSNSSSSHRTSGAQRPFED